MESIAEVDVPHGLPNRKVEVRALHTPPKTPNHLFALHNLMAFVGNCGSGKTNALVSLVREYLNHNTFTRVFVISPTFASNDVWQALPEIDQHLREGKENETEISKLLESYMERKEGGGKKEEKESEEFLQASDVYTDSMQAQAAIQDILDKIEDERDLWRASVAYSNAYRKWLKHRKDELALSPVEQGLLRNMQFEPPEVLLKPVPLLIIDDQSHTDLFQQSPRNPFINLCLRHRHIHEVGLTIMICVQNYRTGIPKCLRQNIRTFFIFATKDRTQTDAVLEEVGNIVDKDTFYRLYGMAIQGSDHDFLTIDMHPPATNTDLKRAIRFRKNFDTWLIASSTIRDLAERK